MKELGIRQPKLHHVHDFADESDVPRLVPAFWIDAINTYVRPNLSALTANMSHRKSGDSTQPVLLIPQLDHKLGSHARVFDQSNSSLSVVIVNVPRSSRHASQEVFNISVVILETVVRPTVVAHGVSDAVPAETELLQFLPLFALSARLFSV